MPHGNFHTPPAIPTGDSTQIVLLSVLLPSCEGNNDSFVRKDTSSVYINHFESLIISAGTVDFLSSVLYMLPCHQVFSLPTGRNVKMHMADKLYTVNYVPLYHIT